MKGRELLFLKNQVERGLQPRQALQPTGLPRHRLLYLDDSITCLYSSTHGCSIFFDRLYEDRIVSTDCQPEAIVVFLDDHTALNKTCGVKIMR